MHDLRRVHGKLLTDVMKIRALRVSDSVVDAAVMVELFVEVSHIWSVVYEKMTDS
jgi:hypothetical protein